MSNFVALVTFDFLNFVAQRYKQGYQNNITPKYPPPLFSKFNEIHVLFLKNRKKEKESSPRSLRSIVLTPLLPPLLLYTEII